MPGESSLMYIFNPGSKCLRTAREEEQDRAGCAEVSRRCSAVSAAATCAKVTTPGLNSPESPVQFLFLLIHARVVDILPSKIRAWQLKYMFIT